MNELTRKPTTAIEGRVRSHGEASANLVPTEHGVGSRLIRVKLFTDHRRVSATGLVPHEVRDSQADGLGNAALFDRVQITRVFLNALQEAGYACRLETEEARQDATGATAGEFTLEGRIWRCQLDVRPVPLLDLDITLRLSGRQGAVGQWQMDFPEDQNLPLWMGLGCQPEQIVHAALKGVESSALEEFQSESFRAALGRLSDHPADSTTAEAHHEIVEANSWTATDQGEITATAHAAEPVRTKPSVTPTRSNAGRKVSAQPGLFPVASG